MIIVYSYYTLDIVNIGHLLMMKNAKALAGKDGKLIVGILTKEAIQERKPKPILSLEERIQIAESIKYVDIVVPQESYSPIPNIKVIRPNILVESASHGEEDIEEARKVMESLDGKVVVLPYYPKQSSSQIKKEIRENNG